MRGSYLLCLAAGAMVWAATGCVSVKAPEKIMIDAGGRPEPVDSSRVPQPQTLAEAQQELDKAYQNLQYLERQIARLDEMAGEYKRERDQCRKRLKKYEDD